MAEKSLKVAAIQMSCSEDPKVNLSRAQKLIEFAVGHQAELIAFPELGLYPWFCAEIDERMFRLAESLDGVLIHRLREIAHGLGIAIVAPLFEKDNGMHFNSMIAIDELGEIVHVYRQVHVPQLRGWEERSYFQGGASMETFELREWRIGVQIGWDNFFPEGARSLALSGADLIIAPTASGANSEDLWERALSANALFNGVYIARVNRAGKEGAIRFYGASFCTDPLGDYVAGPLGESEGVLLCDIERSAITWARKMWPFFNDRKPKTYEEIVEEKDE